MKKVFTHLGAFVAGAVIAVVGMVIIQTKNADNWFEVVGMLDEYIQSKLSGTSYNKWKEEIDEGVDFSDFTNEYKRIADDTWGEDFFFSVLFETGKIYLFETKGFGQGDVTIQISPDYRYNNRFEKHNQSVGQITESPAPLD